LVPDQVASDIHQLFRQYLETHAPATVKWELEQVGSGPGIITDRHSPAVVAMETALETAFGKRPIFQRSGGGIGAVLMFKNTLGVDSILTGFSLYDDNFHGPNEKLHLPTWKRGMAALVYFFQNIAQQ
jgi:acetylornithine deacetylase/succinyl-diaminopimelate desuccinylase-like protein